MSLMSESTATVQFSAIVETTAVETKFFNGARFIHLKEAKDEDAIRWNALEHAFEPRPVSPAADVDITPTVDDDVFYGVLALEPSGTADLHSSTLYTYNPSSGTLTVPQVNGNAASATAVDITNNTSANQTFYPTFVSATSGNQPLQVDSSALTYNPATNTLSVTNITGNISNATNVTITDNTSTNLTFYPTFVSATSGSRPLQVDSNALTFNPATNTLTVNNLAGTASAAVYATNSLNATNATNATNSVNVGVTNDNTSAVTLYPTFVSNNTGNNNIKVNSTALKYTPSTGTFTSTLFSGNLINVSTINGLPYPPPAYTRNYTGNTLIVDIVYGNDGIASTGTNRYFTYFKSISAALLKAEAGENVIVNAGTYDEKLTIPNGVSLTGAGAQCVVIQQENVVVPTVLITVGTNCRLENFTAKLSSSVNVNLTGIHFPDDTSTSTKLRNSIWTITSSVSSLSAPTVVGVLSEGSSALTYTAVNAIQRSTINVISGGNGISRGIYITGNNFFAVRDIVVYARGTGNNIVGVETTNAAATCEIKTSTVSGQLYDINQAAGTILLGFTDLRNSTANNNSFSVVTESSNAVFGVLTNLGNNASYNLVPGSSTTNNLPTTIFKIPITQTSILFAASVQFSGTIGAGATVVFKVFKNAIATEVINITLNPGESSKSELSKSTTFIVGDTYHVTLQTTNNPGAGVFIASLDFY